MAENTNDGFFDTLDLGPFWTPPNVLSLLRLLLTVPVAYLILVDGPFSWIIGLTAAAIFSDWIDGHLARWSDTVSDWGTVMDPVADKIAAGLVVGALVVQQRLPAWLIGLVVVRDVLIILGGIAITRRTGRIVMSTWLGKTAAAALALTVLAALLEADAVVMYWSVRLAAVLLVLAFIRYVMRFVRVLSDRRASHRARESSPPPASTTPPKQEAKNSVASNGST